jgi:pilus assembly protein FimV
LVARVASIEAFRQAGIEYSPALVNLRFSKEIKERGGRRYVELSTDRPLNEPFIDMLVELNWASGAWFASTPSCLIRRISTGRYQLPLRPCTPSVRPEAEKAVARPIGGGPDAPGHRRPRASCRPSVPLHPRLRPLPVGRRVPWFRGYAWARLQRKPCQAGVSLDQMLVSLFRNNQDAFDGGNMNRLKAGQDLSIPDAETVGKVSPSDARKEIVAQAADFNAYRQRLAGCGSGGSGA